MAKATSTESSVSKTEEPLEGEIVQTRAEVAYELLLQGKSYVEIADQLGYSSGSEVARAIKERFKIEATFLSVEDRDSLLALEVARLNKLQSALWASAMYGDVQAADKVLKIIQTRIKVQQLDTVDAQSGQNTVLVVGGLEANYIEKLKSLVEAPDETGPVEED